MRLPNGYFRLEALLLKAMRTGSGAAVVGLPGMGVSHFLDIFAKKHGVALSDGSSGVSADRVILNADFLGNAWAMNRVVNNYQKAGTGQKIILGINSPAVLYSKELSSPQIAPRWYGMYWLEIRNGEDLEILADELGVKLSKAEIEKLESITGGVARFAKYFILNKEKMNMEAAELWEDADWRRIVEPFLKEARKCKTEWLMKMRLVDENGVWKSDYLSAWMNLQDGGLAVAVDNDMWLVELGKRTATLMPFEVSIVNYMIGHDGMIGKDKIAEIKWGNSGEGVSDQAIAKSMQRLGAKFSHHILRTIPKIGYQLKLK